MAKLPHEGTLPAVCGWQVPGAKGSEQDHQRLSADSQFMPIQLVLPPKFPHEYHERATEASLQLRFFLGGSFGVKQRSVTIRLFQTLQLGDTLVQLPYHKSETVFWRGLICDFHAFTHIINKGRCNTMASSASASFFKV